MRKMNRILVPTDFSEGSQAAYAYAGAVTNMCGGKVNLVHVIPSMQYYNQSMKDVGYPPSLDNPAPTPGEEAVAWLEKDLLDYFDQAHQGEVILKTGRKSYLEIAQEAENDVYDLIIMGKTGSDRNAIMGNVTEKVVRHSPKPVLSVNKEKPPQKITRLLVPTDYSHYSLQALRPAALLASGMEGEIILFHVLELFGSPSENEPMVPEQDVEESVRMKLINRVDAWLQSRPDLNTEIEWARNGRSGSILIADKESEMKIPFSVVIQRGVGAHHSITDYAAEHADLIVMNTHGHGGFSNIFIGSTTERVIHQSDKPVLSIRAEEEESLIDE